MVQTITPDEQSRVLTTPLTVVSADSHVGPRVIEDLRPYCPSKYLAEFDDWVERTHRKAGAELWRVWADRPAYVKQLRENLKTAGHYDMHARLRDMDADGTVAEVIYHGSQNDQTIPMIPTGLGFSDTPDNPNAEEFERRGVGLHIYNQWLADVCSIEPERHIGLAHIPVWDVRASVREIEWAKSAGLRSVNWPAPRYGGVEYDDPYWEPLWEVCEALEMPLSTHGGAMVPGLVLSDPSRMKYAGVLSLLESGGWPARRGLHRMIFAGVFERHPGLRLVITELAGSGSWWPWTMAELDSAYLDNYHSVKDGVPNKPSEYCATNVYIGASFIANFEAEQAVRDGYADRVMWGRDYPHAEGVWNYREDGVSTTRLHMRYAFANVPTAETKAMVSDNGIRCYGLDGAALGTVAKRIGAPTLEELAVPLDAKPDGYSRGFRTIGPWA